MTSTSTSPPLPIPPPSGQTGQRPTTPLQRAYPSPKQTTHLGPASVKPHFGLQIWTRGHGSDTYDRGEYFWLNSTSLRGQTAELVTSTGIPKTFCWQHLCRLDDGSSSVGRRTVFLFLLSSKLDTMSLMAFASFSKPASFK